MLFACRHMLLNGVACDVEFVVGSERSIIKAHSYMLISRSPVFCAMFLSDLAEPSNSRTISVPDIAHEAFHIMLRFVDILLSFSAFNINFSVAVYDYTSTVF